MATEDALRGPEEPLTEDDALDELPLSKRMEKVQGLFRCNVTSSVTGKWKLSLSASKRARNVKEKQVNVREALGKMKVGGMASGAGLRVESGSVKLNKNLVGRRGKLQGVASKGCDQFSIVKEIKEIKEKQVAQDKKLDEILRILQLKSVCVEAGSASRKVSLMAGNEEVKVQMDDRNVDAAGDDNPNANSGNVSVTKAFDAEKERKCVEIPFTEAQYDHRNLELIDRQTELVLISLQHAKSVVGQDADEEKCNVIEDGAEVDLKFATMPNDVEEPMSVEAAVGGSAGLNKGRMGQRDHEGTQKVSMGDDDFGKIFTSSNVASGEQGVRGVHDSVVAFTTGLYSNSACVEIERPKRVHKNPERYTPSKVEQDKKKRKIERMECARYTSKVENMTNNPIVLDGFTMENKTWIYELFTNTEWLRSTRDWRLWWRLTEMWVFVEIMRLAVVVGDGGEGQTDGCGGGWRQTVVGREGGIGSGTKWSVRSAVVVEAGVAVRLAAALVGAGAAVSVGPVSSSGYDG
ncbi:unnamed protein product [Cuscuta campestris]|uniref:Uncharacterized protein n=1 Tax=Cuscuta campestris TaxID=132261 RepID=A0A484K2D1_9ASTE|nr:unnamed protein product [Cuscuta campestris]